MCVEVFLIGRLGNNLFQYALGRIIAERLRMALVCVQMVPNTRSIPGGPLDTGASATLKTACDFFPGAPLQMPGRRYEEPLEAFDVHGSQKWRGQSIDLDRILMDESPRRIRLRGWFQRFCYYAPYEDKIRRWFHPCGIDIPLRITSKDVVVNIRRGADYGLNGWALPLSYYHKVLSSLKDISKVYVCGTCLDEQIKTSFDRYQPIYFEGTPIEHFAFMMKFNQIVLSNSTFAWWAAFLSPAEKIFAPRFVERSIYSFTGFEDVDLHMRDTRYCEVLVARPARFRLFVRNSVLNARIARRRLIVAHANGRVHSIRLDCNKRRVADWLLNQHGPVGIQEIARNYDGSPEDFRRAIDDFIHAGVLIIRPTYLEPGDPNHESAD